MGEDQKQPFQLSFNRLLRVGFQGSKVTSNGGLILVREQDERLAFGELIEEHLTDFRASNARFSFADLLRQSGVVGGGSSDAAAVCQHVGADRWIAASVGVAEATGRHENNYGIPQEWRGVWKPRRRFFRAYGGVVGGGCDRREKKCARLHPSGSIFSIAGRPKR